MPTDDQCPAPTSSEPGFEQTLREFTNLIRAIRAKDLSASERAELRRLLDALTRLESQPPPSEY